MKIGDFKLTHNQKEKLVLIHSGLLRSDAKLSAQVMQKLVDYKLVSDSYVVTPLGVEYIEVLLKKKPSYFDAAKKRFIVKAANLSFDMKNLLGGITDGSIEKGGAEKNSQPKRAGGLVQ